MIQDMCSKNYILGGDAMQWSYCVAKTNLEYQEIRNHHHFKSG